MRAKERETSEKEQGGSGISSLPLFCEAELDFVNPRMSWWFLHHAVLSRFLHAI